MNISLVDDDFIQGIVREYSDMIFKIAYQNLKNKSDCEDVIQEVFIKLIKQATFTDKKHMKSWIIRVTINLCKDLNKSAWYRKTEPLNEEIAFTKEDREVLDELSKLSNDYRNVIYLYYFEKYTIAEIANILDKKENTISSQLTRARGKLKDILLEGGYVNE